MTDHDHDHDAHHHDAHRSDRDHGDPGRAALPPWHDVRVGRWPFSRPQRVRGHDATNAVDNARFLWGGPVRYRGQQPAPAVDAARIRTLRHQLAHDRADDADQATRERPAEHSDGDVDADGAAQ